MFFLLDFSHRKQWIYNDYQVLLSVAEAKLICNLEKFIKEAFHIVMSN